MCDFYKLSHREQYPKGTEKVYSTWTPRSNRHYPDLDKIVVFGIQGVLQELDDLFEWEFFRKPWSEIEESYKSYMRDCLAVQDADTSHLLELYQYHKLPIVVKALPEGTLVNPGTPVLTIENTHPRFFWFTNYIETYLSAQLWKPMTVASIARQYRTILDCNAIVSSDDLEAVDFQAHDFSMRGMGGVETLQDPVRGIYYFLAAQILFPQSLI